MQPLNKQGSIVQISISPGGVPKNGVASAAIQTLGLEGDGHTYEDHGGPERAVCLYALERIQALQSEGHPITPGAAGENLTISGLDWDLVVPGARLQIGQSLLLEVTRYTVPCRTIQKAFLADDYARISQTRHPGWSRVYARVLQPGVVQVGDPIILLI